MQVKIKQEPRVFKPVTLEITFETEEELHMMENMLSWNVSIPEVVYEGDSKMQEKLLCFMAEIHNQVMIAVKGD